MSKSRSSAHFGSRKISSRLIESRSRLTPPEIELGTPNQVTMSAKIQITEPSDDTVNRLRRLMWETAEIEIQSESRDLFEGSGKDNVTELNVDVDGD